MKQTHNQAGNVLIYALLGVLIIGVVAFGLWRWNQSQQTASNSSQSSGSTKLSSGNDNTSLQNDVNSIGNSLDQTNQDASSADNALNDQQKQIQVPTD